MKGILMPIKCYASFRDNHGRLARHIISYKPRTSSVTIFQDIGGNITWALSQRLVEVYYIPEKAHVVVLYIGNVKS
jgi:hypothetical protein